jgi:hypothetical protein
MSREERRNYQRMMKNVDRGPALPAAARSRAQRNAARRASRAQQPPGALTRAFWIRSVLISLAVGFGGFSLQWPNMPFAAYLGILLAVVAFAVLLGIRALQRRASSRS